MTINISIGGYNHAATGRKVGRWGCDPCDRCGRRPAEGETVWLTSYVDLYCDECATHDIDGAAEPWEDSETYRCRP